MDSKTQYIDFYDKVGDSIKSRSCQTMNAVRDEAFRLFSSKGFPSKKVEEYRYSDVSADFAPNYGISLAPLQVERLPYCYRIGDAPAAVLAHYNSIADASDPIVALNTMLCVDALVIYVPDGVKVDHPIQIQNVLKGEQDTMMNRRVLVVMGTCAEAEIIITDKAVDQNRFLSDQVMEVFAGCGSHLSVYEVEETHLLCTRYSSVFVRQQEDSVVRHTSVTLFNGHTRNRLNIELCGKGAEAIINGCVIADKTQRVDNNTLVEHKSPSCQSRELYKYVLDDAAVGAFAGKVLVREGAQKTVSTETNANLCATSKARMYSQPMLEIYADDVKCSHGSTVGQMDEQALFYMRQRGISEEEARLLLKSAFITEVIDSIPLEPLRDRLHLLVDKRLRGDLSKCEGCKLCK